MAILYELRRIMTIIGGAIFLLFGFATVIVSQDLYEAAVQLWNGAKIALICFGATIVGGFLFVWGLGYTMSNKDREKMKKYRQLKVEKKKKQLELKRKRERILRKHGLQENPTP